MQGVSLCVLLIGIQGSLKAENTLVVIICMCLGGLIGEALDIDKALKNLGDKIEAKFNKSNSKISEGFVSASLLYCVGAMAIVGSLPAACKTIIKFSFQNLY